MATLRYNARVYEDTADNFAADETIYGSNDLLFATDTGEFKKGNGTDAYADLPAIGGGGEGPTAVAWADVTGKPSTFAPTIGATASTAAAGNHNHAVTADAGSGLAAAANIQALAVALSTRIKALEDAAPAG